MALNNASHADSILANTKSLTHSFGGAALAQPAPQAPNPAPQQGPTSFWSRIGHAGVSAVNALEAPGKALGAKLYQPLATAQNKAADSDIKNAQLTTSLMKNKNVNPNAKLPIGSSLPPEVAENTKNIAKSTNVGNIAKETAKSVVQAPVDLIKTEAGKLTGSKDNSLSQKYGITPEMAIKNQNTYNQKVKAGQIDQSSQDLLTLINKNNPTAGVVVKKMILDGKNPQEIKQFVDKNVEHVQTQQKKTLGDTLTIASTLYGGGEAADILKGGKVALGTVAGNALSGGVGNVGTKLTNNPNASVKDLANTFKGGAEFGTVATLLEGLGGGASSTARTILGKGPEVSDLIKNTTTKAALDKVDKISSLGKTTVADATKPIVTHIPVGGESSAIKGRVATDFFPDKNTVKTVEKNVPFKDEEFRTEFSQNARNAAKDVPGMASSYLKTGSKDPLTLTVQSIADSSSKTAIKPMVEKLVPGISNESKNTLVKTLASTNDKDAVKQALYDAAINTRKGVEAIAPGKKISFEDYKDGVTKLSQSYGTAKQGIAKLPASEQKAALASVNKTHETQLDTLNNSYLKGDVPVTAAKTATTAGVKTVPSQKAAIDPEAKVNGVKVSGIAQDINDKAVSKGLTDGFKDLSTFDSKTDKDQAERITSFVKEDPEKALKVVSGEEKVPAGMSGSYFYKTMSDQAEKTDDVELMRQLAKSPLATEGSVHAQELQFLRDRNPDSAVSAMKTVATARAKAVEGKLKTTVTKATNDTVKEIKSNIKAPTKLEWHSFVDSLKC